MKILNAITYSKDFILYCPRETLVWHWRQNFSCIFNSIKITMPFFYVSLQMRPPGGSICTVKTSKGTLPSMFANVSLIVTLVAEHFLTAWTNQTSWRCYGTISGALSTVWTINIAITTASGWTITSSCTSSCCTATLKSIL